MAKCPPSARGFTIGAPGLAIVDFGTRFGVKVDGNGATQVHVFEGTVEVRSETGKPLKLPMKSGEAVSVSPDLQTVDAIAIDPDPSPASDEEPIRVIDAVRTNGRGNWLVIPGGFVEDAQAFTDREGQWNGVTAAGLPPELVGHDMVRPAKIDGKLGRLRAWVRLRRPATVYILWNTKIEPAKWLTERFELTELQVGLDHREAGEEMTTGPNVGIDVLYQVWRRVVSEQGFIELGANGDIETPHGMYGVVAVPLNRP
jgi:hypothetical protein